MNLYELKIKDYYERNGKFQTEDYYTTIRGLLNTVSELKEDGITRDRIKICLWKKMIEI